MAGKNGLDRLRFANPELAGRGPASALNKSAGRASGRQALATWRDSWQAQPGHPPKSTGLGHQLRRALARDDIRKRITKPTGL